MSTLKFSPLKVTLFGLLLLKLSLSAAGVTQEACQPGTAFNSYRSSCQDCSDGHYQDKPGQASCLDCPEGYKCPYPRNRPIPCPPGTVSYSYVNQRTACMNCTDGYYQDRPGQANCLACPEGHSCPVPKTRPIPCPPGTYSYYYVNQRTTCVECSSGKYQDKPGQNYCLDCPLGMYCPPPRNRVVPCPSGTINAYYTNMRVDCTACQSGYYQAKVGQTKCLLCPEGHECPSPKKSAIPCPPGYWNSYSSRFISQLVKCLECTAGYYQNQTEQSKCIACPVGYSCPTAASGPVACPAGFTSQYSVSQRTSCQRCFGTLCRSPVSAPLVCPPGNYFDGSTNQCIPCATGSYQPISGQSSCLVCPEGFYCPTRTGKPIPCPVGTYSTKDMTDRSVCATCASGTYQTQEGQNVCLYCPAGHFCPRPNLEPVPCPAGTYGSSSITDRTKCRPCQNNKYQDQSGQESCKTCPPGYFCLTPELSPKQCPPNTYSYDTLTDRSKCLPCPLRHYQDQCGQSKCKSLFPDGSSPPLQPNCRSLNNTATTVTSEDGGCSVGQRRNDSTSPGSAYSDAPVEIMEGNDGVRYSVVKILDKHKPAKETVSDDRMLVSTAIAFDKMATAAKKDGVTILVSSGFRTIERQRYLYNCFQTKNCNSGNLAARPGCSRHGIGAALDLNTDCGKQTGRRPPSACSSSPVYTWLQTNGHKFGFVRTVVPEPWHWEFQGGPINGPSNFT